jgi:hypothetical protein
MPTPKLSVRDLFAIVTLVAVLVAWWVDHRRLLQYRNAIHQDLIESELEAAVSRQQLETAEKMLHAMIQHLEPERVGTDFEVSIHAHARESEGGHGLSAMKPENLIQ